MKGGPLRDRWKHLGRIGPWSIALTTCWFRLHLGIDLPRWGHAGLHIGPLSFAAMRDLDE